MQPPSGDQFSGKSHTSYFIRCGDKVSSSPCLYESANASRIKREITIFVQLSPSRHQLHAVLPKGNIIRKFITGNSKELKLLMGIIIVQINPLLTHCKHGRTSAYQYDKWHLFHSANTMLRYPMWRTFHWCLLLFVMQESLCAKLQQTGWLGGTAYQDLFWVVIPPPPACQSL